MTMIIHRDKRTKNKKRAIFFVVSVLMVYGLFFSPIAPYFSNAMHVASVPFWKAGATIGNTVSPFLSYFSSRRELYVENKELKGQVTSMVAKVSDRDFLRKENEELKRLLGRTDDRMRVLAVVLAKPNQTPYDVLVIDVGETQGIQKNSLVLCENVVVGKVEEVFTQTSRVTLFSTAGHKQPVSVGESGITAEAEGLGGGNFMVMLPKNAEVFVGDTIYLPDIEPRIFGVVERIESETKDAFEKVLFKSPVNPFTLSKVEVIP